MKAGIIGLPQAGKKSLFSLLTGEVESMTKGNRTGIALVLDSRFDTLAKMYNPRKKTRARIEVELLSDLEENAVRDGAVFGDIAGTDALCLVVRSFEDDRVFHVRGSVNPGRDIESINSELFLHDLLFIEKRLERIEQGKKKGEDPRAENEEKLLVKMRTHLERDLPLRTMEFSAEEASLIAGYPFITRNRLIVALNIDEDKISTDDLVITISSLFTNQDMEFIQISARLENEIASLETEDERKEFLRDAGIREPALNLLSRTLMESLGLISYFTVGEDEVRQWMVHKGSTAPKAAGVIHSDIERGFIRAEVMKYSDLTTHGSEEGVKKAGKQYVMGKDYIVEDGDIISFRFNV